jgi:hypothetical protein
MNIFWQTLDTLASFSRAYTTTLQTTMLYALRFLLYGGVWSASLALISLPISLLPPVQRVFPKGYRQVRGMLLTSSFAAVAALGTLYGLHLTTEWVDITITSDPTGADIYVAGEWHGITPMVERVPQGSQRNYAVVADPLLYYGFAGMLRPAQDTNVAVWLERLTDSEQEELRRRPLYKGDTFVLEDSLNVSEDGQRLSIDGRLSNQSGDDFAYIVVSFLLFDAENAIVGTAHDIIYDSTNGETRTFSAALNEQDFVRYRLLNITPLATDDKTRRALTAGQ